MPEDTNHGDHDRDTLTPPPPPQTPPHGGATAEHPLPLAQGWRWLSRFVNGLTAYVKNGHPPPVPTGPVLEWFLKVINSLS